MYRSRRILLLILLSSMMGCAAGEGTESEARKHLTKEFEKWQAGERNEARTVDAILAAPPISFDFYSVTPCKPELLAFGERTDKAFKFKVKTVWISSANTELTKSATYVLTWIAKKKEWHIQKY